LPCPASDTSPLSNRGFEATTATPGVCDTMHGFVPYASIGLSGRVNDDGFLVDAWLNPLRYSVVIDELISENPDFSSHTSIRTFFDNTIPVGTTQMFSVCEYDAVADMCGLVLTNTAPAVVMSMGANGNDFSSEEETINAGSESIGSYAVHDDPELIFISETYAEDLFDDQIIWLSPYVLFNRLVSAGKLP